MADAQPVGSASLKLFRDDGEPEVAATPGRIESGSPSTRYIMHATGDEGRISAGVWRASVGAWRVSYTEWEYCMILSGRMRLHPDDGTAVELSVGDGFAIAPGFSGVWEVVEDMAKHFVIVETRK